MIVTRLLLVVLLAAPAAARAQERGAASPRIRLDQIGFYPAAPKIAVIVDSVASRFAVVDDLHGDTVFRGRLAPPRRWAPSEETVRQADFSSLHRPGRYAVVVPGVGRSYPFVIDRAALRDVGRGAVKAFYFQRASMALEPRYAGRWSRPAGHPDTAVLIHPSAAGPTRAAGTTIASPGGWYDAGDYNKYVVNSGISTYTLLLLCEQYPNHVARLTTGIPESGGGVPDLLGEILWNLRWMRTMQDPADGGVYHKLTNAEFDRFERPDQATAPRYVVQKSTAATLDFAAVMAHASLVARRYPQALPGLADSLVAAAKQAWEWARAHPDVVYDQRALNARYQPAIATGEYGDAHLEDERSWAAAELFAAPGIDSFRVASAPLPSDTLVVPSWGSVQALGLFTLVEHRAMLPSQAERLALEQRLVALARPLVARARSSAYGVPIGGPRDWVWGSNAVVANQGIVLLQAYRLTADTSYRNAAVAALDYLLGRNATGYSFVTGYGAKTPLAPHHRPSASDTVAAPIPGLLVGGPNPGQQDHCGGYPSTLPALSYVDQQCNYAANEVAINWNAPFAFLSIAIDAIFSGDERSDARRATSRNHRAHR